MRITKTVRNRIGTKKAVVRYRVHRWAQPISNTATIMTKRKMKVVRKPGIKGEKRRRAVSNTNKLICRKLLHGVEDELFELSFMLSLSV